MAVSINWSTKVIFVPKADLTLVQSSPNEIRELDIDWFRLQLRSLEDDPLGMSYLITHNHNAPVSVAGLTLGRVVELINDYTVTFEDGSYAVNIVGGNSNIADVTNVNGVSVRPFNSAGLVQVSSGSGLSSEQAQWLQALFRMAGLDVSNPLFVPAGAGTVTAGDIEIEVVGDCENGHTFTRQ